MTATDFIFPKNRPRDDVLTTLVGFIHRLPTDKSWRITVEPYKKVRSTNQNAYLWSGCYQTIIDQGGEQLAGWEREDVHEYMLGEHFGWETIEGFGRKRMKPLKRSSKLSTMEFVDFVAFIQQKAAELGIYIADPDE